MLPWRRGAARPSITLRVNDLIGLFTVRALMLPWRRGAARPSITLRVSRRTRMSAVTDRSVTMITMTVSVCHLCHLRQCLTVSLGSVSQADRSFS